MRPGFIVAALVIVAIALPDAQVGTPLQSESTPIFLCGEDQSIPGVPPQNPSWPSIVLAGDGKLFVPCPARNHTANHREFREAQVIATGLRSMNPEIRWRAAQATVRSNSSPKMVGEVLATSVLLPACNAQVTIFGDLTDGRRWQPGQLFRLMVDRTNPAVRKEGAYGIAVRLGAVGSDPDLVRGAAGELRACYMREIDPSVQGQILETLGVIRYGGGDADVQRTDAETFIVQESNGQQAKVLGAARGLEVLIRQNPRRPIAAATRERLRQMAVTGNRSLPPPEMDVDARIRRLAVMSLLASGGWDSTMNDLLTDSDWQVRRLIAARLNLSDPEQAVVGERLDQDVAFQVRYDLLTPQSRLAAANKSCAPMLRKFSDPSPAVVMRAMDLIAASCTDLDEALKTLKEIASGLESSGPTQWHVPARAFANLARLKPALAGDFIEAASRHRVWEVRAVAATATVALGASDIAERLAQYGEPNVMNAALEALARLKSPKLAERAIAALNSSNDIQLLRTAATVVSEAVTAANRDSIADALIRSLRRLGDTKDTSRDARLAIMTRLDQVMTKQRSADLLPLMIDLDDTIIAAARKTYIRVMDGAEPMDQNIRRRYPFQPPEAALLSLPKEATINLAEGPVTLKLLPDVAPVTVARFAMLVNQKFYDNRTFHRIVPNFVVQGGSPGANEYMGTSRYMRDEAGPQAAHIRGAVGISTRGGDTGDGQIFIDLVDLPRLDRDYTVFAYVTGGMELVDKLLEGGKILSITVK